MAGVALRAIEDADRETLFELMRDPESVRMAAFTAADPDDRAEVKPRLPQESVIHHEQYDLARSAEGAVSYERVLGAYYDGQGRPGHSWAQTLETRFATVAGLHGRHTMSASLDSLGLGVR